MNDYTGIARKRSQNLLIVEGSHEKNELFWLIFKCFTEINIDMDDVWIYGTNIYRLYDDIVKEYGSEWTEDDIDLPFVISKKNKVGDLRYKEDFVNIILVFDYERHDTSFSEKKILDMQKYFKDAADTGMLYINYPMIESYQHFVTLPDPHYAERKISVSVQPGKVYKEMIRNESAIMRLVEFPHKIAALLNEHFGINDKRQWEKCYNAILNLSEEKDIDEKMQEILQGSIDVRQLQTAKYLFLDQVSKIGYAHNNKSYWQYMRVIFQQIVCHNISKANWILKERYEIEENEYKSCFEQIDLTEILNKQNESSKDIDNGFIWVLNTCVFFIAEYNFKLIIE